MTIKQRTRWVCGESMGMIDSRDYDRLDTCGKIECQREERDAYREEREEAHRELDESMRW